MLSDSAMRGVVTCRSSSQPNTPAITGVSVNTAAALTRGAAFNPSNLRPKQIPHNPPRTA